MFHSHEVEWPLVAFHSQQCYVSPLCTEYSVDLCITFSTYAKEVITNKLLYRYGVFNTGQFFTYCLHGQLT